MYLSSKFFSHVTNQFKLNVEDCEDIWVNLKLPDLSLLIGVIYRQSGGEGVCPVRTFCGQGERKEVLQMRTSAIFGAKNFGFFKIYDVVRTDKRRGGLSQLGHIADSGREKFFAILCGRLLWTAPYIFA